MELPAADFTPPDDFPWTTYHKDEFVEIQTADVNATLEYLMSRQIALDHLRVKSRTLEDLLLELTGRELRA